VNDICVRWQCTGVKGQREIWEREYASPDPLWRGPAPNTVPGEGRVLELGCGNGKTLSSLVRHSGEVIGLDHSINALRQCPPGPSLVRGDVLRLPFQDERFDTVLLHHVLQHLYADERELVIGEVRRVLRPGGILSIRTFSVRDMRFGKGEEVERNTFRRGNGLIYHYFEADELRALLSPLVEMELRESVVETRFAKGSVRAELVGTFQR
jgi:SAM-dependent methyltransferase